MRTLAPLLLVLALGGIAAGQACSTLSTSGSINPGDTLTLTLTGADADTLALAAVGDTLGTTTIGGGPFSVTLDLDRPFAVLPFGFTDANGDASFDITVPSNLPPAVLPDFDLYAQAVTADLTLPGSSGGMPGVSFCVSNTVTIAGVSSGS